MWNYRLQGGVAIAGSAIKNLAANPVDVMTHMLLLANDNCSIYRLAHGARQLVERTLISTSLPSSTLPVTSSSHVNKTAYHGHTPNTLTFSTVVIPSPTAAAEDDIFDAE
jgi:hypothetical protein